jgi:hypothetical protein
MVTYAGGSGVDAFNDVVQISNGTILVCGSADNLLWLPNGTPTSMITSSGINNAAGTNKFGIILQYDSKMQTILQCVYFPQGTVENIRWMKFTSLPYAPTGDLYVSGKTADSKANNGGYFIAKLDNNFVNGVPTAAIWSKSIWAEGVINEVQPWDVGSDGKVVFMLGQTHAADWSQVSRLKADGSDDIVPNWRIHWTNTGSEVRMKMSSYTGAAPLVRSGIVLKKDGRCELRSWNAADYNLVSSDGNGGTRKGKWPLDFMFNSACDSAAPTTTKNGPGYNKYKPSSTQVYGGSAIAIDKRNNNLYVGFNTKSVLHNAPDPDLPDFEPVVMAMDTSGELLWWTRLYHEITANGDTVRSTPDQYVDGLAIDYKNDQLLVDARCHGNNTINFWRGNQLLARPSMSGFQNQFTGTNGNIHISWLGKIGLSNGYPAASTYVAEYFNTTTGLGTAHPDPNLDAWPNPNTGWPNLNDTRIARGSVRVSSDGSAIVVGTGRRTITTANAHQKMVKQLNPSSGNNSSWNQFVRVYSSNLDSLKYSSLVVGKFDTITGSGGDNIVLNSAYKTRHGVVAVGYNKVDATLNPIGNAMLTTNVPTWGSNLPQSQDAVLAYYQASNIYNFDDSLSNFYTVALGNNLELIGFAAQNANTVQWKDMYHKNVDQYKIMHSLDGINFYELSSVIPTNKSNYEFIHKKPINGNNYYRLQTVLQSGQTQWSNIVNIFNKYATGLNLFPNPAQDYVIITDNSNATIAVINAMGQVVKTEYASTDGYRLDVSALPAGVYIVTAKNKGTVFNARLIIQ